MSVYFQKIPESRFKEEASFVVRESRTLRIIIGLVALAIAGFMLRSSVIAAILIAVFGMASILASRKNRIVITINKEGFFYYESLVTNWKNFVSAKFIDQAPQLSKSSLGFSDQFFIALRYRKEGDAALYERKIPLTNTQDKSEEEIMAAIRFYYKKSQAGS